MLPNLPRDQQLTLLRKMLMIRRVEEHVVRFNEEHEGLIRGHFHIYIGQEATGVGVCSAPPKSLVHTTSIGASGRFRFSGRPVGGGRDQP